MTLTESNFTILTPFDTIVGMLTRIELAGRTCYKSECKITRDSADSFVRALLRRGHESVIEHEYISVRIVCDRGVSHEIVRHRLASYSQESTRYCDYGKSTSIKFILPGEIVQAGDAVTQIWKSAIEHAERAYFELRAKGVPPQFARSVLPTALKTELVMTANLREWRHFFKLRTAKAAHPQIQRLATAMLKEFYTLLPVIFEDLWISISSSQEIAKLLEQND